ncbi:MAG: hypothetical protein HYY37_00900 [Candidatus Aenigmarchaeota archaeon]|nr:hypothetical protein [Candidatus Aenigmarchaeota archaeon]
MTLPEAKERKPPSPWRVAAIRHAIRIGSKLAVQVPSIADDYRNGMTQPEIAEKYDIPARFGCRPLTARAAVSYALGGYEGGFDIDAYEGLISSSELLQLARAHATDGGLKAIQNGKGMFALSTEEKRQAVFNSHVARGHVPLHESESATAYAMSQLPEYRYQHGPNKGKANNVLIAQQLNNLYHGGRQVRSNKTVTSMQYNYRKRSGTS